MKEVLAKVYETKQSGRKSTEVLSELKTDFLMHFLTLKKLNRHSEPKFENLIKNYLFCCATKGGLIVFFFSFWLKSPKKCAQNYPEHLLFTVLVINVGLGLLIFRLFSMGYGPY